MFLWLKKVFWKRCYYCKKKKEFFFYTWELPGWASLRPSTKAEGEVCTDCAKKGPGET
jgi:hypothetical protein